MADLVCVKTYLYRHEAEIDQAYLEPYGVRSIVSAEDAGGMQPHLAFGMGGVKLLVLEDDAEKARELLESGEG